MFKPLTKSMHHTLFCLLIQKQARHRAISSGIQKDNTIRTYWNCNSNFKSLGWFFFLLLLYPLPSPSFSYEQEIQKHEIKNTVLNFIKLVIIIRLNQWIKQSCVVSWVSSTARVEQLGNQWTMENPTLYSFGKCLK